MGNAVVRTTTEDVIEEQTLAAQNIIEELRLKKESNIRALYLLEKRLSGLRMDESRLLNKLYPAITVEKLAEKRAGSQSTILDIQAYDPYDMDVNLPTERVMTFLDKLKNSTKNLNGLLKTKQTEIKDVLSKIKAIQSELEDVNNQLASKGAPTDEDMETDRLLRRQSSEVMMLWEVYQQYKIYSTTVDGGAGFSQDSKVTGIIDVLTKRFQALKSLHPELKDLNIDNIGSINNEKIIRNRMEILKVTTVQSKIPEKLKSYINSMQKYTNDQYSHGVNRRASDAPLPENNSMDQQTKTASRFLRATESVANWTVSFDLKDVVDAKFRNFLQETADLNNGCPLCEKLPQTKESQNKQIQEVKNVALDEKATTKASEKISKQVSSEPPEPVTGLFAMMRGMFKAVEGLSTIGLPPDSESYKTILKETSIPITGPLYVSESTGTNPAEVDLASVAGAFSLASKENPNTYFDKGIVVSGTLTEDGKSVYYSYGYTGANAPPSSSDSVIDSGNQASVEGFLGATSGES